MFKTLFNAVYNRKNRLLANGTALVQVEAYYRGKKKYFSTGIYLKPDQWNKRHRQIKNHPNQISLNKQIKDFVTKLEAIELKLMNNGKPYSLERLKDTLQNNIFSCSFIEFCIKELDTDRKITEASKCSFGSTVKHLSKFAPQLNSGQITYKFITEFENYLYNLGFVKNTVSKHLGNLRIFVNRAIDKDVFEIKNYPFRKFKIKKEESKRTFLTPGEIAIFENIKLPPDKGYLQLSLDMFLFSIYTGMRYSDVINLLPEDIQEIDKYTCILIKTQKNKKPIELPVSILFEGKALKIIEKYKNRSHTALPYVHNRTVNRHIHELTKLSGLKKYITFHCGRHTFATFLLNRGTAITTIQTLLGHSRVETTQIYSKVTRLDMRNELKNISYS